MPVRIALVALVLALPVIATPAPAESRAHLFPRDIPVGELTTGSIGARASALRLAPERAISPPADKTSWRQWPGERKAAAAKGLPPLMLAAAPLAALVALWFLLRGTRPVARLVGRF